MSQYTVYTTASGESRTTCPDHRRAGYAVKAGTWICRGCGAPMAHHETSDETVARKAAESRA